ncbi:hypothetical protein DFJ77DRAFT_506362 [Powellomyces hirtus]|nr:hypothetical protein DFJ77DRAFT_506362 [Powellomyces hirtus]
MASSSSSTAGVSSKQALITELEGHLTIKKGETPQKSIHQIAKDYATRWAAGLHFLAGEGAPCPCTEDDHRHQEEEGSYGLSSRQMVWQTMEPIMTRDHSELMAEEFQDDAIDERALEVEDDDRTGPAEVLSRDLDVETVEALSETAAEKPVSKKRDVQVNTPVLKALMEQEFRALLLQSFLDVHTRRTLCIQNDRENERRRLADAIAEDTASETIFSSYITEVQEIAGESQESQESGPSQETPTLATKYIDSMRKQATSTKRNNQNRLNKLTTDIYAGKIPDYLARLTPNDLHGLTSLQVLNTVNNAVIAINSPDMDSQNVLLFQVTRTELYHPQETCAHEPLLEQSVKEKRPRNEIIGAAGLPSDPATAIFDQAADPPSHGFHSGQLRMASLHVMAKTSFGFVFRTGSRQAQVFEISVTAAQFRNGDPHPLELKAVGPNKAFLLIGGAQKSSWHSGIYTFAPDAKLTLLRYKQVPIAGVPYAEEYTGTPRTCLPSSEFSFRLGLFKHAGNSDLKKAEARPQYACHPTQDSPFMVHRTPWTQETEEQSDPGARVATGKAKKSRSLEYDRLIRRDDNENPSVRLLYARTAYTYVFNALRLQQTINDIDVTEKTTLNEAWPNATQEIRFFIKMLTRVKRTSTFGEALGALLAQIRLAMQQMTIPYVPGEIDLQTDWILTQHVSGPPPRYALMNYAPSSTRGGPKDFILISLPLSAAKGKGKASGKGKAPASGFAGSGGGSSAGASGTGKAPASGFAGSGGGSSAGASGKGKAPASGFAGSGGGSSAGAFGS